METYEGGGHAYHATMPTDSLRRLRELMIETEKLRLRELRERQIELGRRVRALLAERGFPSVAGPGFEAPCVVVSYTPDADLVARFGKAGVQVAAGVPLMVRRARGLPRVPHRPLRARQARRRRRHGGAHREKLTQATGSG